MELANFSHTNNNQDEIVINYFFHILEDENNTEYSRNEKIYFQSILTNICKLSGTLELDSYDAIYDLYCLLHNKNRKDFQVVLRDIDRRIMLNRSSTHQNHLHNLPLGLKYILQPKFLWTYFFSICFLSKWFYHVYLEMVMSVILQVKNTKVSLGQVLYTEYFLQERLALLSTLSENILFIKTIEVYNIFLQFSMATSRHFFSWIFHFISSLFCLNFDKEKNESIVWSFFETQVQLPEKKLTTSESSYLPSFLSNFFSSENLSRNTMKAIRLGATPSRDITILTEMINKVTEEGEYILYILSTCLSVFCLLLLTYIIIYLSSWLMSYRTKLRLMEKLRVYLLKNNRGKTHKSSDEHQYS